MTPSSWKSCKTLTIQTTYIPWFFQAGLLTQGHRDSIYSSKEVGLLEGAKLGLTEGVTLGVVEGCRLGAVLGLLEGLLVGRS